MAKFFSILRIILTHLYVWIALYLGVVLVVNTVRYYQFMYMAAEAFYKIFVKT